MSALSRDLKSFKVKTDLKNRIVTGMFPCLALRALRAATCRTYFSILRIGCGGEKKRKGTELSPAPAAASNLRRAELDLVQEPPTTTPLLSHNNPGKKHTIQHSIHLACSRLNSQDFISNAMFVHEGFNQEYELFPISLLSTIVPYITGVSLPLFVQPVCRSGRFSPPQYILRDIPCD